MDENEWLAERFEEHRAHLRAVAYRMLGSLSEADDAGQEAWLRVSHAGTTDVQNLGGWLTTVIGRVCLNMLRSRRTRREAPLGSHVPDPLVAPEDGTSPEHEVLIADSVGLALLVVLEMLPPAERLAFVLHDMFAVPFDEIAPAALVAVLDPDVVLRADGGALPGASAVLHGSEAVAGQALMFAGPSRHALPVLVNGAAGVVITVDGRPVSVMGFTVTGGKIVAIDALVDPERLSRLRLAVLDD